MSHWYSNRQLWCGTKQVPQSPPTASQAPSIPHPKCCPSFLSSLNFSFYFDLWCRETCFWCLLYSFRCTFLSLIFGFLIEFFFSLIMEIIYGKTWNDVEDLAHKKKNRLNGSFISVGIFKNAESHHFNRSLFRQISMD